MTYTNAIKGLERPLNKLKPCPFCGGEAEIIKSFLYGKVAGYVPNCKKCGCQLPMYTSKQNAKNAWNRRANNDRSTEKS